MAYYTNLINAWNSVTQPPTGVTGTGLTGGMSTVQKLAAVNAWTVTGSVPTSLSVTGPQILNCINYAEFATLAPQAQTNILLLCNSQGPLLGGSANTAYMVDGLILASFSNKSGPTISALTSLAQASIQLWWTANGYTSQISLNDLLAAGTLT